MIDVYRWVVALLSVAFFVSVGFSARGYLSAAGLEVDESPGVARGARDSADTGALAGAEAAGEAADEAAGPARNREQERALQVLEQLPAGTRAQLEQFAQLAGALHQLPRPAMALLILLKNSIPLFLALALLNWAAPAGAREPVPWWRYLGFVAAADYLLLVFSLNSRLAGALAASVSASLGLSPWLVVVGLLPHGILEIPALMATLSGPAYLALAALRHRSYALGAAEARQAVRRGVAPAAVALAVAAAVEVYISPVVMGRLL